MEDVRPFTVSFKADWFRSGLARNGFAVAWFTVWIEAARVAEGLAAGCIRCLAMGDVGCLVNFQKVYTDDDTMGPG